MFNFLFGKKKKKEEKQIPQKLYSQPIPADYKFQLTAYNRGNDIIVFDPTEDDIKKAIATLSDTHENFIIIESSLSVKNITFLQATDYDISAGEVYLEAQKQDGAGLHNYGKMIRFNTLFSVMTAYINGDAPQITEDWEFIGDF